MASAEPGTCSPDGGLRGVYEHRPPRCARSERQAQRPQCREAWAALELGLGGGTGLRAGQQVDVLVVLRLSLPSESGIGYT